MKSAILIVTLLGLISGGGTVSVSVAASHGFCYDDPECGPESSAWPPLCHNGTMQSPIDIDTKASTLHQTTVDLFVPSFGARSFIMQNNGHTLSLRFNPCENGACTNSPFFPGLASYTFSNVHFHFGKSDREGSEHTLDGQHFGMELHAVHYKSMYESQDDAVNSGDPDALAVVAVLFKSNKYARPSHALAPILRNLHLVQDASEDWVHVQENLDLYTLVRERKLFSYHGSLTTPPCSEAVQWFIYKKPILISPMELEAFRTSLRTANGDILQKNWRPTLPVGDREVSTITLH